MKRIESLGKNLVKGKKRSRIISLEESIHKREAVFVVQHIEVAEHILILDIRTAESDSLVKYRQRITHRSVSLVRNHME